MRASLRECALPAPAMTTGMIERITMSGLAARRRSSVSKRARFTREEICASENPRSRNVGASLCLGEVPFLKI